MLLLVDVLRREQGHGPALFAGAVELLRGAVVQRTVGTLAVILLLPACQLLADIAKSSEPGCVEALVAEPAMEALDVAVLHRSARLDRNQLDLALFGPAEHTVFSDHALQSFAEAKESAAAVANCSSLVLLLLSYRP